MLQQKALYGKVVLGFKTVVKAFCTSDQTYINKREFYYSDAKFLIRAGKNDQELLRFCQNAFKFPNSRLNITYRHYCDFMDCLR